MVQDAMRCSRKLAVQNAKGFHDRITSEDYIIQCVGLDHLVSRDAKKRYHAVHDARTAHVHLVLEAQKWLLKKCIQNHEALLAGVSMKNSLSFQIRSYKIALLASFVE